MGIRDKPIAPGSPWQNGFAERLIGSIRRECVDHLIVLGEAHLRRILTKYAAYYNELRTHRSLGKDAPIHRAIQHEGRITSEPLIGGLHHFVEFSFWYRQLADICCPNHFAPFIGEFDDVFAEFGACKSCVAKLGNPQLDSGINKTSVDCLVEIFENVRGRVPRGERS